MTWIAYSMRMPWEAFATPSRETRPYGGEELPAPQEPLRRAGACQDQADAQPPHDTHEVRLRRVRPAGPPPFVNRPAVDRSPVLAMVAERTLVKGCSLQQSTECGNAWDCGV